MFSVLRRPYFLSALGAPAISSHNNPYDVPEEPITVEVPTDGWGRVKAIFRTTKYELMTPEFATIYQTSLAAFFIGSLYGGIIVSRKSYQDFMESNQATRFLNQIDGKRRIQDAVFLGFIKGGLKWGIRIAYFTAMYTGLTTIISVYRNKNSIFEYSFAGFIAGAIYKIPLGIRGMLAGGIVCSFLSSLCGILTLGLLKLSGKTMQSHRSFLQETHVLRENAHAKLIQEQKEKDEKKYLGVEKGLDYLHKVHRENDDFAKTLDGLSEDNKNTTIIGASRKPEDVKK